MSDTQKQTYALFLLAHAHNVAQQQGTVAAKVLQAAMLPGAARIALRADCAPEALLQDDVILQALVYASILHGGQCLLGN